MPFERYGKSLVPVGAFLAVAVYWGAVDNQRMGTISFVLMVGLFAFTLIHDWVFAPLRNQISDLQHRIDVLEKRNKRET